MVNSSIATTATTATATMTLVKEKENDEGLKQLLKPFYDRAALAEERLSRLEAQHSLNNGISEPVNEEYATKVKELEFKLEEMTKELAAEREMVAKLTTENNKKDYRIIHLVRGVRELKLDNFAPK